MCELYTSRTLEDMKFMSTIAAENAPILANRFIGFYYERFCNSKHTIEVAVPQDLIVIGGGLDDGCARSYECGWRANNLGWSKKLAGIFAAIYEDMTTVAAVNFLNRINATSKTIYDMHFVGIHRSVSRSNYYLSSYFSNCKSVASASWFKAGPIFDVDQLIVIDRTVEVPMIGGQP